MTQETETKLRMNPINNFEIIISSLPYKERPVADIYYDNMYWAQISQETDDILVHFYSHPTEKCWEFQMDEALEVIKKAKTKLLGF